MTTAEILKVIPAAEVSDAQVSIGAGKVLILSQEDSTAEKMMEFRETFEKRFVDGSFPKDVLDKSLSDINPPSRTR